MTKTFLDSSVLISAARGNEAVRKRAIQILGDANRSFVVCELVKHEALWLTHFHNLKKQRVIIERILGGVAETVPLSSDIESEAFKLSCAHGLGTMDAHLAASSLKAGAAEFVTVEKDTKPYFAVPGLGAKSIAVAEEQTLCQRLVSLCQRCLSRLGRVCNRHREVDPVNRTRG